MKIAMVIVALLALGAAAQAQLLTTGAGKNGGGAVVPASCTMNITGGPVLLAPAGGYAFTC